MTLFLTDADVRAVFDWPAAADALRSAYAAPSVPAMFPPRTMARGDGLWLRTLSGVGPDGGMMGAKMIAASIKGKAASYLISLFDQQTVELTALLDGNSITGFRTAATSALATDVLAAPGAIRVAVIGSGFEARHHLRALAAIRPIEHVAVFSPRATSRAAFAEAMADLDVVVRSAESAESAVADATVVICAARSRDETPIIDGAWLRPGMTIISIGSTLPEQREIDSEVIRRADLIVADMAEEVAHDTGDMLAARAQGVDFEHKLVALADVVGGAHPGRSSPDTIVLYKSVGAALQDLAVAEMCVARATARGIGTRLPVSISPVAKGGK